MLAGCTETKEPDPDRTGYNYFPLEAGTYRIYKVEGVRYNAFLDSTVFSYKLKEAVVDTFSNLESGISYILHRQTLDDNGEWQIDSVWTARRDDFNAVTVEHNVPIVKLVFPFEENKIWDGNRLNDKANDEFEMVEVRKPWADSFGNYNLSVTVIEEELPDTFVNFISKKEVYAKDVGLVYKENIVLDFMQGEFYGKGFIESGIRYHQYLIEYGKE